MRPWALAAPILVLLICLPLMRPLRHPDPEMISDDEQARLATIQAIVEQHTLQIQGTIFATRDVYRVEDKNRHSHWYSDQSPVMAALLSGPYWVMYKCGLSFERNPVIAEYLLTLFGVTLPIAFAAGLFYRMGRMFELRRPYRAGLALAVVIGSGWISYATVLSAGAAAAALVVMGAAALVQATLTRNRNGATAWVAVAGLCVSLAATYELTGLAFLVFLFLVVAAFRWPALARVGAVTAYVAGAAIPILLYVALNRPITGDLLPGFLHPDPAPTALVASVGSASADLSSEPEWNRPLKRALRETPSASAQPIRVKHTLEDDDDPPSFWRNAWRDLISFAVAFIGSHGLLTHFPVLILGMLGILTILRRHWPRTTKVMACATVLAGLAIVIGYTLQHADWSDAMFANRWFLVFLPLTLFWSGAWLRRSHQPATWVVAGVLWGFSALIALLGATDPQPRQGYDRYTAAGAFMHLVQPQTPQHRTPELVASDESPF
ncbi:MAG TPA: hypothetical protein VGI81_10235 [Tepidisphaeraceae bacterium]